MIGGIAVLVVPVESTLVTLLPLSGAVFASRWPRPGMSALAIMRLNQHVPAAATGIGVIGIHLGGVLGPLTLGLTADDIGYDPARYAICAVLFFGAALIVIAKERHAFCPRNRDVPGTSMPGVEDALRDTSGGDSRSTRMWDVPV